MIELSEAGNERSTALYGTTSIWTIEPLIAAEDVVCARLVVAAEVDGRTTSATYLGWFVFGQDERITTARRFGDQEKIAADLYG